MIQPIPHRLVHLFGYQQSAPASTVAARLAAWGSFEIDSGNEMAVGAVAALIELAGRREPVSNFRRGGR